MAARQNNVDKLQEYNKRIDEILTELHKDKDIFDAKKNILENPEDRILRVDPKREIPFERFFTREQKR